MIWVFLRWSNSEHPKAVPDIVDKSAMPALSIRQPYAELTIAVEQADRVSIAADDDHRGALPLLRVRGSRGFLRRQPEQDHAMRWHRRRILAVEHSQIL